MVSLLATTSFALHTPLALWFDRRMLRHPGLAAPRADDGFDQILEHSSQADAPSLPCLCVTPEGKLEEEGRVVGAALCVGNAQEQSAALALVGSVEWILVEAGAPQPCIVAENLLAATEGSPTRVAVCVDSAASVPGLAFALQRGVDALVCPADVATGELLEALQEAQGALVALGARELFIPRHHLVHQIEQRKRPSAAGACLQVPADEERDERLLQQRGGLGRPPLRAQLRDRRARSGGVDLEPLAVARGRAAARQLD